MKFDSEVIKEFTKDQMGLYKIIFDKDPQFVLSVHNVNDYDANTIVLGQQYFLYLLQFLAKQDPEIRSKYLNITNPALFVDSYGPNDITLIFDTTSMKSETLPFGIAKVKHTPHRKNLISEYYDILTAQDNFSLSSESLVSIMEACYADAVYTAIINKQFPKEVTVTLPGELNAISAEWKHDGNTLMRDLEDIDDMLQYSTMSEEGNPLDIRQVRPNISELYNFTDDLWDFMTDAISNDIINSQRDETQPVQAIMVPTKEYMRESFREQMMAKVIDPYFNFILFYAEGNNKLPIGWITYYNKPNSVVELKSLYVNPEFRRKGVGSWILTQLIRDVASSPKSLPFIWVFTWNNPSIVAFFEKNNFRITDTQFKRECSSEDFEKYMASVEELNL